MSRVAVLAVVASLVGCGRVGFDGVSATVIDAPSGPGSLVIDAPPGPAPLVDDPALLAYWPLDEAPGAMTFADLSPYGNAGDCIDCPMVGVPGVRGSAVEFGADPAGIHITTGPTLNAVTGPLTVAAWTRVVGTEAYGIILSNDRDCCGTYNGFSLYASHYNTGPAMLTWAGTQSVASGAPLPPDTWVHVVGTFDGSNVRVYVDGTEVASATGAIGAPPSFDLWLGTMAYVEPFTHIHGAIDEVLILGRALAPAEIVALRAAYSPP